MLDREVVSKEIFGRKHTFSITDIRLPITYFSYIIKKENIDDEKLPVIALMVKEF